MKNMASEASSIITEAMKEDISMQGGVIARDALRKERMILELQSIKGFLRIYPDFLEWKLGLGVVDDIQRVMYHEIGSVSMRGSINPPGGMTTTLLTGGANLLAAKKKEVILNVGGAIHTFEFNLESTQKVRAAVDIISEKTREASIPRQVATASPSSASLSDELAKLIALHSQGLLTDDELSQAKAKLLT